MYEKLNTFVGTIRNQNIVQYVRMCRAEAAHRSLLTVMASTGIHESISMQTASNHVIYLLYDITVEGFED